MANINDFKLVKIKSQKMFQYLKINKDNIDFKEVDKERIGFYHLILENVTGIIDFQEIFNEENHNNDLEEKINNKSYTIIDTEYNKIIYNNSVDDLGIDAVYIKENDKAEIDIKLFNFKYRNKFNPDKTKNENDISRSTKFLEYIIQSQKLDTSVNQIVHENINEIIDHLNSNMICNITLYMVSNEANGFSSSSNTYINILEKNYDMKIVNISLDEIISFFNA